jgi:hypothetical protein
MASDATALWPGAPIHVLSMIELHVETLVEAIGKGFSWRIIPVDVLMTD